MMEFSQFIKSFPIRTDIFDDITYLQKHLRLLIKFHQKLSSKLYVSTSSSSAKKPAIHSNNFYAIREFMDILEGEMDDISNEQKMLTDIVKKSISQYLESLTQELSATIDRDTANGYVTRALQFHYQKHCFSITPNNVKVRMSEDELKLKYDELRTKCLVINPINRAIAAMPKRESLLKPNFRKPTSTTTTTTSGKVEKKPAAAIVRSSIIETRHSKINQQKTAVQQQQQGITGSRMNLLRALNKVKTEQIDNPQFTDVDNGKYIRSDEDCSDQSSYDGTVAGFEQEQVDPLKIATRKRKRSPISNASSDIDLMKVFPPLPKEAPAKMDYTKEEFLSIFMLITPQIADELKAQKSKRKRRNCFKNEKNDFHYGNFDLNEAAFRLRMCNNKRSILYSPNNKRK